MVFQFSVCNKLAYKLLPLFLQVPVLSSDEIVPVYNDRRNCPASVENYGDIIALRLIGA